MFNVSNNVLMSLKDEIEQLEATVQFQGLSELAKQAVLIALCARFLAGKESHG